MTEQEQRADEKSGEQTVSRSKPDPIRFTKTGTPRQRQPYAPRRDRGRFSLSPRDEWGMRYVADMYALRFDHLLGMVALWDYQETKRAYQEQMSAYQEHLQGKPPAMPMLHPPERGKVQSVINRWVRAGYALTDQPYKTDPIWLALTKKGVGGIGAPLYARAATKGGTEGKWASLSGECSTLQADENKNLWGLRLVE